MASLSPGTSFFRFQNILLRFETKTTKGQVGSKIRTKCRTFFPVKIRGEMGKIS